jgi:hypothetical protein
MSYLLLILSLLVGCSSLALAQSAGGSTGGSAQGGATAYTGGTLSTGHTISGTAGSADPTPGNALSHGATGDAGASSVTQPPTSHDNAVDTPTAKDATNRLSKTDTGILKK